jgi:hypothetical protein
MTKSELNFRQNYNFNLLKVQNIPMTKSEMGPKLICKLLLLNFRQTSNINFQHFRQNYNFNLPKVQNILKF